jgi:hypothetical protein
VLEIEKNRRSRGRPGSSKGWGCSTVLERLVDAVTSVPVSFTHCFPFKISDLKFVDILNGMFCVGVKLGH